MSSSILPPQVASVEDIKNIVKYPALTLFVRENLIAPNLRITLVIEMMVCNLVDHFSRLKRFENYDLITYLSDITPHVPYMCKSRDYVGNLIPPYLDLEKALLADKVAVKKIFVTPS
jgi:hypothetical protein